MIKIITILGARPQFIKAGTVSREIIEQKNIKEIIIHTGQHYDQNMSDVFFDEMKIPKPDYFLGIGGKSHGAMTGQMIEKIEEILIKEKPDWVLVYGDTNSTLAGAIAASKLNIKIAHIEAGLRSYNMSIPEEINRILTDKLSYILFCPTQTAIDNLIAEGVDRWRAKYYLTGDVMQDGALFYRDFCIKPDGISTKNDFILATVHRADNTDDPHRLREIIEALNEISKTKKIIFPIHPRTKKKLEHFNILLSENIIQIDPVGYLNMVWLIKNSSLVITDSGGLQKEAFFFSKPCLILQEETVWVELVENNFNVLTGANKNKILDAFYNANHANYFNMNLYGNGKATKLILEKLIENS